MFDAGHIRLHRKVMDSYLWSLPADQMKVGMTCLLMANWKDAEWWDGSNRVAIKRGQFATSLERLAGRASVSVRTVRTALKNLERCEFLTSRSTNRYRTITILNYDSYQVEKSDADKQSDKQPTSDRQGADKGPTTIEKELEILEQQDLPPVVPPVGGKAAKEKPRKRNTAKPTHPSLEALLSDCSGPGVTYLDHWCMKYPALDGRDGRPTVEDLARDAWDHQARRKRKDMPRYVEGWIQRDYQRFASAKSRRNGGRMSSTEATVHAMEEFVAEGYRAAGGTQ